MTTFEDFCFSDGGLNPIIMGLNYYYLFIFKQAVFHDQKCVLFYVKQLFLLTWGCAPITVNLESIFFTWSLIRETSGSLSKVVGMVCF